MKDFVDNSKEFLRQFEINSQIGLEAIGLRAEGYAKEDCPVDTGRLRNSISHSTIKDAEIIGTNVEYASKIELDEKIRHTTGKAHFLRDSATTHGKEYKKLLEDALKG